MFRHLHSLMNYEFRRFKGLSRVALIFILLIPLLYGGIYLAANWDLYAHISQVKVAVVNHDKPATFGNKTVDAGADFVQTLKSEPTFDWQFLGTDDDAALDGLHSGEYFMIITIPEDFSQNLISAGSLDPHRAVLVLHRDDANGFIIGTLTGKAEDALAKTLDETVSRTYFKALFANLEEIRDGMYAAADGSAKLDRGLSQAASGVSQLNQAVQGAAAGAQEIEGLADQARQGLRQVDGSMDTVNDGLTQVNTGSVRVMTSAGRMADDVREISRNTRPMLDFVAQDLPRLQEQAADLVNITATLKTQDSELTIDRNVDVSIDRANDLLAKHPELADDPAMGDLLNELHAAKKSSTTMKGSLDAVATISGGLKLQLDTTRLSDYLEQVNASLDKAERDSAGVSDGFETMSNGMASMGEGMKDARAGARSIADAAEKVVDKTPEVVQGVMALTDALGRLDTAMPQLSSGAHELATKLDEGAHRLPALSNDQQDTLSAVMSSPVDVQQVVEHDAKYYGRGLAPMFFSIALWIAGVSTFLVVRTISGRALTGRGSAWRIALSGFGPLAVIGIVGSLIMGFGVWFLLGLDPVHPWLFTLLLIVAAVAFMALAHWMRLVMGSPQTAVFLIALIMQLPACGGTFPVTMLSPFFQAISVISPMKYSVDAFRVVISGGSMTTYWFSMAVLIGIAAASIALIVWLAYRRQIFRMRDLHPPMVTSTSTADYAFSVRPR